MVWTRTCDVPLIHVTFNRDLSKLEFPKISPANTRERRGWHKTSKNNLPSIGELVAGRTSVTWSGEDGYQDSGKEIWATKG